MSTAVRSAVFLGDRQRVRFPHHDMQPHHWVGFVKEEEGEGEVVSGLLELGVPLALESQSGSGQETVPLGQVSSATSLSTVHKQHA